MSIVPGEFTARYESTMARRLSSGEEPTPANPASPGEVTPAEFSAYPVYYLYGAGRPAAKSSRCPHAYGILDSCPCC